jgi:hypothetical protein
LYHSPILLSQHDPLSFVCHVPKKEVIYRENGSVTYHLEIISRFYDKSPNEHLHYLPFKKPKPLPHVIAMHEMLLADRTLGNFVPIKFADCNHRYYWIEVTKQVLWGYKKL